MKTHADSGRKGGIATLERYGRDQLVQWGKKGGRPRSKTCDEIRGQRRLLRQSNNNHKEVRDPPGNLNTLKKLYVERHRSSGEDEIQGAVAPATTRGQLPERNGTRR